MKNKEEPKEEEVVEVHNHYPKIPQLRYYKKDEFGEVEVSAEGFTTEEAAQAFSHILLELDKRTIVFKDSKEENPIVK